MKNTKWMLMCFSLLLFGMSALAQTSSSEQQSIASVFNHSLSNTEREFVSAADAMPAEKYSYAPTSGEFKGVRTFALEVRHVATVNYEMGAVILGEKSPVEMGKNENGSDTLQSKEDIMKYLKDSFAYLHKAFASLNQENLVIPIKSPWGNGTVTRLGMALIGVSHPFDHYGQMVEYLRSNGIVPPASRG